MSKTFKLLVQNADKNNVMLWRANMSNLAKCGACSKEVSRQAKTCPNCGHPVPQGMGVVSKAFVFLGLIGMMSAFINAGHPAKSPVGTSEPEVPAAPKDPKVAKLEKRFGSTPIQSGWDGSYREVEAFLKARANDPGSLKFEGCTGVSVDQKKGWVVGCDYRGKNAFGGLVLNSNWFVIKNGKVVSALPRTAYSK